jgi:hypothetical protein
MPKKGDLLGDAIRFLKFLITSVLQRRNGPLSTLDWEEPSEVILHIEGTRRRYQTLILDIGPGDTVPIFLVFVKNLRDREGGMKFRGSPERTASRIVEPLEDSKVSCAGTRKQSKACWITARGIQRPESWWRFSQKMARNETETLCERIQSGLAAARRKGIKLGRPLGTKVASRGFSSKAPRYLAAIEGWAVCPQCSENYTKKAFRRSSV